MATFTLNIYTSKARHEVVSAFKEAVLGSSGWIAGHTFYSNTAATLRAAVERHHIDAFLDRLIADGLLKTDDTALQTLRQHSKAGETAEVVVSCSMTFLHTDPDLKHDVPAVPG